MRTDEIAERVAAELLARRTRELECDAGLRDHSERLDGRGVAPLDKRLCGLAALQVDRRQRPHQGRQRLHGHPNHDRLTVRHPTFDPTGVIRRPVEPTLVAQDLVVRLRSAPRRECEAVADLHALDRLGPHQRRRQPCVESLLLRRVRPQARRNSVCDYLDDAANRVAVRARLVHPSCEVLCQDASLDADSDLAEKRLRHRPRGDDDGRMARARAFKRVANVGERVLHRAREISVSGTRQGDRLRSLPARLAFGRPWAHAPRPVVVIAIADEERNRRPERSSVTQAGEHLDLVALDLLPRAAAVSLLPPVQVGVDRLPVERQSGGQPGDDPDEGGPVRLARRYELERHQAERTAARITSTGAGIPVQSSNEAAPCAIRTSSPSTTRAPAASAARPVAVSGYGRSINV